MPFTVPTSPNSGVPKHFLPRADCITRTVDPTTTRPPNTASPSVSAGSAISKSSGWYQSPVCSSGLIPLHVTNTLRLLGSLGSRSETVPVSPNADRPRDFDDTANLRSDRSLTLVSISAIPPNTAIPARSTEIAGIPFKSPISYFCSRTSFRESLDTHRTITMNFVLSFGYFGSTVILLTIPNFSHLESASFLLSELLPKLLAMIEGLCLSNASLVSSTVDPIFKANPACAPVRAASDGPLTNSRSSTL